MCNENCVFSDVKKIKVSREVAHAFEFMPKELTTSEILKQHIRNPFEWYNGLKPLMDLTIEELATALIVGYEVEMTPHQAIAKEYADAEKERLAGIDAEDTCLIYQNLGIKMGIEFTLNALDTVVEGVNDK